ncbi:MAG: hypothetical protein RBU23_06330 [Candidatus Auribacterota bacterium]|nr:hypothetical protein [Candidatus Auribacterota bacterium]
MKKAVVLGGLTTIFIMLVTGVLQAQYGSISYDEAKDLFSIRDIRIKRVRVSSESGTLSAVSVGRYTQDWYKIWVRFDSKPEWADGVQIKYYVLLSERSRKDRYTMLTGDVVYDSVPRGNGRNSFMYIHPRTIERYGIPEKVMCEIWFQGIRITRGFLPKQTTDEWWVQHKPLKGDLKVRLFTPYILDNDMMEENINIKSLFD